MKETAGEDQVRAIIETAPGCVLCIDAHVNILEANPACLTLLEARSVEEVAGISFTEYVAPEHLSAFKAFTKKGFSGQSLTLEFEMIGSKGARRWLKSEAVPRYGTQGKVVSLLCQIHDITGSKRTKDLLTTQSQVLEMVATGAGLPEVLNRLCLLIEQQSPGALCSIFLLDESGSKLRSGAAPSLPKKYAQTLDGLMVNDRAGSCGTAAALGKQVIVHDIAEDPLWADSRDLALKHGIRSCWSTPFFAKDGKTLGTFAISHQAPCSPTPHHQQLIKTATHLAGIAVGRKQVEKTLTESEEKYRILYEENPTMYFTVDSKGTVLSVNRFGAEQLGYRGEELIGQPVLNVVYKEDKNTVTEQLHHCLQNPAEVAEWELRKLRKDGGLMWVKESACAVEGADGEVIVLIVCRDITLRKQAEEKRRESEARFRQLAENIDEVFWITVPDRSKVIYVSPAYERIWKRTCASLYEDPESRLEIIHPEDRQRVVASRKQAVNGAYELEYRIIRPDGDIRWIWTRAYPIRNEAGEVYRIVGISKCITERKQAEAALRKWADIFTNSQWGIAIGSEDGQSMEMMNPAFAAMHGYTVEELTGRPIKDVFPVEMRSELAKYVRMANQKGHVTFETKHKRKDGTVFPVSIESQVVKDESGKIKYRVVNVRDITVRKQAQEALLESEERYRQLVELSPDMICVHSKGKFVFMNTAGVNLLGAENAGQLTGKPIMDFVHPDSREIIKERIQNLHGKKGLKAPPLEEKFVRLDGRTVDVEVVGVSFTYQGKPAIQVVAHEISERKRAQEEQVRLATAIEQSAESVIITDPDGTIQYVNPAFERTTGYKRQEAIGKTPRLLKSDQQEVAFYKNLWDTLKKGEVWSGRFINKKKDGSLYEDEASISPVCDAAGKIINYVAVQRDVTREVALEEQLHQAQKMETIGTLAGGVAHDFNNLLTAIIGNAEFGKQDTKPGEPAHEDFLEIEKAAYRARDLTDQLLSFSRRQVLKKKYLDLSQTIDDLLKMLGRILGEDIDLQVSLAPRLPTVFADPGQLQQVLMNLFANARDAMPEGGKLTLETCNLNADQVAYLPELKAESTNYVRITITDTGTGMNEETRSHIFEPFYTTKEVGKGTGLGLSVVYGIVKQHEGHIEVNSEVSRGTTFKIFLPAVRAAKIQHSKKTPAAEFGHGETILVVEDDETVRNVATRILTGLNYEVLVAQDGREAMKIFKAAKEKIDLALIDVVMPQVSGPEIYKKLSALKPDLPVIFVTGYDVQAKMTELDEQSQQAQVEVLQKPYTKESLGQKIHEVLR